METKRFLTQSEIENIISFIQPQKKIPRLSSLSIVENIKNKLRSQLKNQFLYPSCIPELKQKIEKYYYESRILPGCSVGIISAQSIGERQTQSLLNSFHFSGLSDKVTVTGVPRMLELINATKKPQKPFCTVYFNSSNKTLPELRDMIGSSIVEFRIKDITVSHEIRDTSENWYNLFFEIYEKQKHPESMHLVLHLNRSILFDYRITLEEIASRIEAEHEDIFCMFSPDHLCELHIFADMTYVLPSKISNSISDENHKRIYLNDVAFPNLETIAVCGIPKIKGMYITKDSNPRPGMGDWAIETDGSNLQQIFAHPNVDVSRTLSNDPWEIYKTLGIEATRQYLIEEFSRMTGDIATSHILFLVDKMTFSGTIGSLTRYSMRKESSTGVLSRSTFEETISTYINAGTYAEKESTTGVSAAIICGKLANTGTGFFTLHVDKKMLGCGESE